MAEQVTRAVPFPIREIVGSKESVVDTFEPVWRLSTDLANWAQQWLTTHDVRRLPGMTTLPPFDPKAVYGRTTYKQSYTNKKTGERHCKGDPKDADLYSVFGDYAPKSLQDAWAGNKGSLTSILRNVESTWLTHPKYGRYRVLWLGESRACTFRYAYPWHMRADTFKIFMHNQCPSAELKLPGRTVVVRLAGGPEFRRQLKQYKELLDHPERIGGSKITARFEQGRLRGAMFSLVGHFDHKPRTGDSVCFLHTDPSALLVAEINDRQVWIANADHLKRWHAAHRVYLQRSSEDMKRENRMDRRQRRNFMDSRSCRCDKSNNRINTAIKQIAAQVLRLCQRQDVGILAYDDTNRNYFPDGFCWFCLSNTIRQNVECYGVVMSDRQPDQEKDEWLTSAKNLLTATRKVIAHKSRGPRKSHPGVSIAPEKCNTSPLHC